LFTNHVLGGEIKDVRDTGKLVRITRTRVACDLKAATVVIQLQADEKKSRQRAPKCVAADDLAARLGDVTNLHAPAINSLPIACHQLLVYL
jgi:hypothetical protein